MTSASTIIEVLELYYKQQVMTDGTTTPSYIDIPSEEIAGLGPYLAGITLMTCTESRTAQHGYKVVFYWTLDGRQWNGPVDLCASITSSGDVIHTEFTDATKLGIKLRLAISVVNSSGTNVERAVSSAWAVLRYKS